MDGTLLGRQYFGQQMLLVNIYIDLRLFCRQLGQWMVDVGHFQNIKSALEKSLVKKITFRSTIVLFVC